MRIPLSCRCILTQLLACKRYGGACRVVIESIIANSLPNLHSSVEHTTLGQFFEDKLRRSLHMQCKQWCRNLSNNCLDSSSPKENLGTYGTMWASTKQSIRSCASLLLAHA